MQISGKALLDGKPEQVWEVMMNPETLSKAIPGCQKLEEVGEDNYIAHVELGVAAIKGKYEGKVSISDKQFPEHYQLAVEGEGGPGWVKATMVVDLEAKDERTEVQYDVNAEVGGLIASVGNRLLSGVAKMLMKDMFKQLNKILKETQEGE